MTAHQTKSLQKRLLILLLSGSLLLFSLLPISLAWLSSRGKDHGFSAEIIMGYFKEGTGTVDSPYIIATAKHFYNFSWLQNIGAFKDRQVYLAIDPTITELDMAGALSGIHNKSGAIPPIGNDQYPFTGSFDGNGVVIKNLWVSTDEEDWYEKPEAYEQCSVGTDIGLFGNVGYGANITDFYLQNIEVTNTVNDEVNLGILAGYVDGNISNIGIKNAKLSFKENMPTNVSSEYSMVGKITDNVIWKEIVSMSPDGTGGSGGELLINPTARPNDADLDAESTNPVYNSLPGTAFYSGALSVEAPSPNPTSQGSYYKMDGVVFNDNATASYIANKQNAPNKLNFSVDTAYSEIFPKNGGKIQAIFPEGEIQFSSVTGYKTYPGNSIWFKPIGAGECAIAFCRQSNDGAETMSIIRFQRDSNGKVIENSKDEIVLILSPQKANGLGNGTVTCFTLTISENDVKNNYEYVIGATSAATKSTLSPPGGKWGSTAGFLFLKLAGTDLSSGNIDSTLLAPDGKPYRMLNDIDFVENTDVDLTTVDMHRSILELSGTQNAATAIYYDAADGKVLYCNETSLTMTQAITSDIQAQAVTRKEYTFEPRDDT